MHTALVATSLTLAAFVRQRLESDANLAPFFDPASGGYFLFSHLREGVLVRAGDVVPAGAPIGRVGHTGNAVRPRSGKHLHIAYKRPGIGCGIEGVLVSVDPFRLVRAARGRDLPLPGAARPPAATPAGSPPASP